MIYAYVLVPILTLLLGGTGGYFLGRYQNSLLNKIRTLEEQRRGEPKTEPTVIAGAYQPPAPVSTAPDNRSVGLVESKTPELLDWESQQAIEKEALGR